MEGSKVTVDGLAVTGTEPQQIAEHTRLGNTQWTQCDGVFVSGECELAVVHGEVTLRVGDRQYTGEWPEHLHSLLATGEPQ